MKLQMLLSHIESPFVVSGSYWLKWSNDIKAFEGDVEFFGGGTEAETFLSILAIKLHWCVWYKDDYVHNAFY